MKIFGRFTILISALLLSACNESAEFAKGDCVQRPDSMIVYRYEGKTEEGHQLSQSSNPSLPSTKIEKDMGGYIESVCK